MSATDAFETSLLSLIFQNKAAASVGDGTGLVGSGTAGSFYIGLHTGTPDLEAAATQQGTSEAAYTSYARQAVPRTTGATGWTVSGNTMDNATAITFPTATGGSETETRFGIGGTVSGAGTLFLYGTLTAALGVSTGIIPQFAAGALDVTLD